MGDNLIGYVRKSKAGKALNISIDVAALNKAETYEGGDGRTFVPLVLNIDNVNALISGEKEVTGLCQIINDSNVREPTAAEAPAES